MEEGVGDFAEGLTLGSILEIVDFGSVSLFLGIVVFLDLLEMGQDRVLISFVTTAFISNGLGVWDRNI
jgi:hypothetical protein